jgi:hypothetical protein
MRENKFTGQGWIDEAVKFRTRTSHECPEGKQIAVYSFFTLGYRWSWVVNSQALDALSPGKTPVPT